MPDLIPQCYIKIDGSDLADTVFDDVIEVTVESSLHLASAATITFFDDANAGREALTLIDSAQFDLGKSVTISIKQENTTTQIFDGEIVEVEPEFRQDGIRYIVRAFDKLHRLARGRKVRTFTQVSDSDLVSQIAGEEKMSANVTSTTQIYDVIMQHNQTNLEFLQQRAAAVGHLLYVSAGKLEFHPPTSPASDVTVTWNEDLVAFSPRATAVDQVDSVSVRGWNPKTKEAIVGEASSEPAALVSNGTTVNGSTFGAAKHLVIEWPMPTQDAAQKLATSLRTSLKGRSIHAEGVTSGTPGIVAGKWLEVKKVGTKFNGKYFITNAIHTYGARGGYSTSFTVSGYDPATLLHAVAHAPVASPMPGLYIGIVTNNKDTEGKMNRVKVKLPSFAENLETDWARVITVGAGATRGVQFIPEVNDEVVVGFERGDVNYPFVLGGLWNGKDSPPVDSGTAVGGDGKVKTRVIQTRSGHTITFDDSDDKPSITIKDKSGNSIVLDAQQNSITITAQKDITLKATGDLKFSGTNVKVEATAQMELKASAGLKADGGAEVEVKGGMIKLN